MILNLQKSCCISIVFYCSTKILSVLFLQKKQLLVGIVLFSSNIMEGSTPDAQKMARHETLTGVPFPTTMTKISGRTVQHH